MISQNLLEQGYLEKLTESTGLVNWRLPVLWSSTLCAARNWSTRTSHRTQHVSWECSWATSDLLHRFYDLWIPRHSPHNKEHYKSPLPRNPPPPQTTYLPSTSSANRITNRIVPCHPDVLNYRVFGSIDRWSNIDLVPRWECQKDISWGVISFPTNSSKTHGGSFRKSLS